MGNYLQKFAKKNILLVSIALILQLVANICAVMIPLSYQNLIDNIIGRDQFYHLSAYIFGVAFVFALNLICDVFSNFLVISMTAKLKKGMKQQMMEKVLHGNSKKINKYNKGEVITRISQDVDSMVNIIAEFFIPTLIGSMLYLFMVFVIFTYNIWIGVVCLFASPLFFLMTRFFGKGIEKQTRQVNENAEQYLNIVDECLEAKNTIVFYDCYDYENKRYLKILDRYIHTGKNLLYKSLFAKKTFSGLGTLFPIIVMLIGTMMIQQQKISVGILISILACLNYILMPSTLLSNCLIGLRQFKVSRERLKEFFERDFISPKNDLELADTNQGIHVFDMSFAYPQNKIFSNVNFHINRNEFVCVVGKNGTGKTTLLDIISGLKNVTAGTVNVNGMSLDDSSMNNVKSQISPVWQNEFLFDDTVYNNIYLGKEQKGKEKIILDIVGRGLLDKYAGKNGSSLSGGEKQKVAISRALNKESNILIIDEGSTNLDSQSVNLIHTLLEKLKGNITIIIVDHHMMLNEVCDKILFISSDDIFTGTHQELMKTNEDYHYLYGNRGGDTCVK